MHVFCRVYKTNCSLTDYLPHATQVSKLRVSFAWFILKQMLLNEISPNCQVRLTMQLVILITY